MIFIHFLKRRGWRIKNIWLILPIATEQILYDLLNFEAWQPWLQHNFWQKTLKRIQMFKTMRGRMDQQAYVSTNVWILSILKRRSCIWNKGKLKISCNFTNTLLQTKFNLFSSSSTEKASDRFINRVTMNVSRPFNNKSNITADMKHIENSVPTRRAFLNMLFPHCRY